MKPFPDAPQYSNLNQGNPNPQQYNNYPQQQFYSGYPSQQAPNETPASYPGVSNMNMMGAYEHDRPQGFRLSQKQIYILAGISIFCFVLFFFIWILA